MPPNPNPSPEMFVLKMTANNYGRFAKEITKNRNYQLPPGQLLPLVEQWLQDFDAEVYTSCDGAPEPFDPANDRVIPQPDNGRNLNISLPKYICEKAGKVDIEYLKGYVRELRSMSDEDGAWALLGMYFLSRCR